MIVHVVSRLFNDCFNLCFAIVPARSAGFGSGVRAAQHSTAPSKMLERCFFLRFWAARDAMGFVRGGFIKISVVS